MHTSSPHLPDVSSVLASKLSGVTELVQLGVISAKGEDAAKFLQGQLTQDMTSMDTSQAHLAAFCNAKGRIQASFVVFKRSNDDFLLVCSRDLLAQTLKRLSLFVLRAKVKLAEATADFILLGLSGDAINYIAKDVHGAGTVATIDDESIVFLSPGAGQARALWCAPAGTAWPAGVQLQPAVWAWLEVQSGIAMVTLPIFEAFVPQMLNYESVGGVNFKKGCYPGQEVIARSQFRGTLKRRAYAVHCDAPPHVGQDVFHVLDAAQPCGTVAACAAHPDAGFDAIVSMQTAAAADAADGRLTLGEAHGAVLALRALPYPLLEDI